MLTDWRESISIFWQKSKVAAISKNLVRFGPSSWGYFTRRLEEYNGLYASAIQSQVVAQIYGGGNKCHLNKAEEIVFFFFRPPLCYF